jgi:hypothetical protein
MREMSMQQEADEKENICRNILTRKIKEEAFTSI